MTKEPPNFWQADKHEYIDVYFVHLINVMYELDLISRDTHNSIDLISSEKLYFILWSYKT